MPHKPNQLRIIAGKWRSRLIKFPDLEGVRPTPNRIRETLFNWLQQQINGARCLDLFAGSGALGFEALSRGAASVTFVDNHADMITHLEAQGRLLEAEDFEAIAMDALSYVKQAAVETFDIVFLDPPFQQNWVSECLQNLLQNHWLAPGALIYVEQSKPLESLELPPELTLLRHKRAGEVSYGLIQLACG